MHAPKQTKSRTVRLAELRTSPDTVARAARRPGGVAVVDDLGVERFRLWIPSTRLE